MKKKMTFTCILLCLCMAAAVVFTGCANQSTDTSKATADELYFTQQEVRKSPEWVTKLDAAKDAEQLIVVAGVDKTTAYVTMHEKNQDGEWEQLIATPGFIGLD
ncbi:MAG: hypothetical protein IJI19_00835, partial [Ruminococcus sp.]|nr:hypothetical protein [Ruminococcus sp.]